MTKHAFSLMTYNIHKGFGVGKFRFLLPQMRDAIKSLSPDFVFLQEVQGIHFKHQKKIIAWPELPQFEYIAEKIWPHYVYAKNAVYLAGHHGNAILSKLPFDEFENINLSNINRASRGFLHATVMLPNTETKVHLLCVHFGLFKAERKNQCKVLMRRIMEFVPENEPLLMAGDFNDWREDISKPLAQYLNVHEAFFSLEGKHAKSFPAISPYLCIDRVYYRGLQIEEAHCLRGKPWRMLSDHIPLYVKFKIG